MLPWGQLVVGGLFWAYIRRWVLSLHAWQGKLRLGWASTGSGRLLFLAACCPGGLPGLAYLQLFCAPRLPSISYIFLALCPSFPAQLVAPFSPWDFEHLGSFKCTCFVLRQLHTGLVVRGAFHAATMPDGAPVLLYAGSPRLQNLHQIRVRMCCGVRKAACAKRHVCASKVHTKGWTAWICIPMLNGLLPLKERGLRQLHCLSAFAAHVQLSPEVMHSST